ncbi:hypothetical protein JQ596_33275 [Bradyrhizobium manausense]|nr:hypothetical protein [Bradyrhizobium manausense]MBR0830391.1 hypothetical protein [Bradyrhizobium manausense]
MRIATGSVLLAALSVFALSASPAMASKASDRAKCLAEAGTTEAIFSARKATYAQGAIYKSCMTRLGHDVTVRRGDGSKLY